MLLTPFQNLFNKYWTALGSITITRKYEIQTKDILILVLRL